MNFIQTTLTKIGLTIPLFGITKMWASKQIHRAICLHFWNLVSHLRVNLSIKVMIDSVSFWIEALALPENNLQISPSNLRYVLTLFLIMLVCPYYVCDYVFDMISCAIYVKICGFEFLSVHHRNIYLIICFGN